MPPAKKRKVAAVSFWVLLFPFGVLEFYVPATTGIVFAELYLFTGLIFAWVHFDAQIHEVRVGPLFRIGIVAVSIIFVPIHLFRSRGAGGAFKSLGIILGLTTAFILFTMVVAYLVTGSWNAV